MYLSQIMKYICLKLQECICLKLQKCICLKLMAVDSRWAGSVATACVYPLTFIIAAQVYLTLTQIPWKSSKHF